MNDMTNRTQWAVQALLRNGQVHTGQWMGTREQAEESAARLVALNGSLCWLVKRHVRVTLTEWVVVA